VQHLTLEGDGVVVSVEVRRLVWLALADGGSCRGVAARFAVSSATVWRIGHDARVESDVYRLTPGRLSLSDREEISRGLAGGRALSEIARSVGCHRSTVHREVARNGGRVAYRAARAHADTLCRGSRPKATKFVQHRRLAFVVESWLQDQQWSPAQISARLQLEFPDDETMRVSHETIYQALYVHGRGGLRKELARHLRSQRPQRRPRPVTARNRSSKIPDMINIAERPDEVDARVVPGHWEGDLIMGTNNGSQVATLVERTTGLVLLGKLTDKSAVTVAARLQERIGTLPGYLARSITWDQGAEMAAHRSLTIATGIPVYFCDPHAPWQRGSNENINGLLRQYLPRDTDLSRHSQADLDTIAHKLNTRPRKRHDWLTPLEVFDQLVLH
jgi:transposase, IS30 family